MLPEVGPHFPNPIKSVEEAVALTNQNYDVAESLAYMYKAITLTRHLLNGQVPLIGFCGAPWTLMAYMIEGGGSKQFIKAKTFLFTYPEESKKLLMKIGQVAAEFLVEQIKAGAQLVQIFDSWAGELSPKDFRNFELPVLKAMLEIVRNGTRDIAAERGEPVVPVTCFAKGANYAIPLLAEAGFDVVGLDWCVDPAEARTLVKGKKVALQGNMDPSTLYAGNAAIERTVKEMFLDSDGFLSSAEGRTYGHIANLGHGITPNVDPEAMKCKLFRWTLSQFGWSLTSLHCAVFLECVHKYSQRA
jgi:uroporphyrinogen decarboxylase